jgi:hypothetical protein
MFLGPRKIFLGTPLDPYVILAEKQCYFYFFKLKLALSVLEVRVFHNFFADQQKLLNWDSHTPHSV